MKPSKLRHWFLVHFVAHFLVHFVANSVAHLRAVVLTTVFAAALAATAVGADKPDRDADDLPDKLVAAIEQRISAEMKRSRIPGLSVAVAVDNKLRYAKGFGWADLENKFAATPDTVYRTA
ncbi:MAG: serine hydrolase domain-containing protein, partial [Pirellulaceae bacterium]|nr:serine hydrolase domain-containing protein [Pirellulaceae bacterium]